jgi:DNA-binding transcriptional regulator YdaS (Cro superfamily)
MKLSNWLDKHRPRQRHLFAAEIGVKPPHLSRIALGTSEPSPTVARRILTATSGDVTFEDLYGDARETESGEAA